MRPSIASLLSVAIVPIAVSAAPFIRGTDDKTGAVVQFAQLLEQLESTFYQEVLSTFKPADFTNAGFISPDIPIEELTIIAFDEQTHGVALGAILTQLNLEPITCSFDFSSVLTSASVMISAARTIEYVGVSAFLGSVSNINDPTILTGGATILTTEARHQSILNVLDGHTAIPQPFDVALLANEVVTIAQAFFSGPCNTGITPNTALTVTNTGTITTGTQLEFSSSAIKSDSDTYYLSCQIIVGGSDVAIVLPADKCIIPGDINGPAVVFLTSDSEPLKNDVLKRASQPVLAGPTIIFVDSERETLGELVRDNDYYSSS